MTNLRTYLPAILLSALVFAVGCGEDSEPTPDLDAPDAGDAVEVPAAYAFESRFTPGESSVAYSGQTMRQTLIADLTSYIGGLTNEVDTAPPAAGDVRTALLFYYAFDDTGMEVPLLLTTDPPLAQTTYGDISGPSSLKAKLAGNDTATDHRDWNAGAFVGWTEGGATTPEELLLYWFDQIDALAVARGQGTPTLRPDGTPADHVYVTAAGQDLRQLVQKFLLGAVTYAQGTDDYLDDDVDGKGLLTANERDEESAYTKLEHHWDEAFGYFGAARDYNDYTDDEIAGGGGRDEYQGFHDSNADGAIDLRSEFNFGASTNAAKRDRGSHPDAKTDYSRGAMDAFLTGRAIIAAADGPLDEDAAEALAAQRDIAVANWELAIAATVVHYINDTLQDMATFGTEDYSFENHAKHWSELKGFALGLQFNPRSRLSDAQFAAIHSLIGDAPVLPNADAADIAAYEQGLLEARDIMQTAYGFDARNVGDANGENGW